MMTSSNAPNVGGDAVHDGAAQPASDGPYISALYLHPLKSGQRIAVASLTLGPWGPINDRRWMLVDANGNALTQRDHGAISQIVPSLEADAVVLDCRGEATLRVPIANNADDAAAHALRSARAIVWGDDVDVLDAGDGASAWCSAIIGSDCRLVQLAPWGRRPVAPKYAGPLDPADRYTSLNDGAPLLLLGEASLVQLNARLAERGVPAVSSDRFRANVMIANSAPHDEDTWSTVQIGNVTIGVGSSCPRCVMTTIDQATGSRAARLESESGGEPLRTLALYRRDKGGVMFGANATNATNGVLRVGDAIVVHARK